MKLLMESWRNYIKEVENPNLDAQDSEYDQQSAAKYWEKELTKTSDGTTSKFIGSTLLGAAAAGVFLSILLAPDKRNTKLAGLLALTAGTLGLGADLAFFSGTIVGDKIRKLWGIFRNTSAEEAIVEETEYSEIDQVDLQKIIEKIKDDTDMADKLKTLLEMIIENQDATEEIQTLMEEIEEKLNVPEEDISVDSGDEPAAEEELTIGR